MATARQAIRETVIDRLYAGYGKVRGTTDGAGDTSSLIDGAALKQAIFKVNDLIGAYIWMSSGTADEEVSKIIAFDRTLGDCTLSPVLTAATGSGSTYEIHYEISPVRVNDAIIWAVELGTNGSLTGPTADATTTTLEKEIVVQGALGYIKKAIARQTTSRDPQYFREPIDKAKYLKDAEMHLQNWRRGLMKAGFNTWVGRRKPAQTQGLRS